MNRSRLHHLQPTRQGPRLQLWIQLLLPEQTGTERKLVGPRLQVLVEGRPLEPYPQPLRDGALWRLGPQLDGPGGGELVLDSTL